MFIRARYDDVGSGALVVHAEASLAHEVPAIWQDRIEFIYSMVGELRRDEKRGKTEEDKDGERERERERERELKRNGK